MKEQKSFRKPYILSVYTLEANVNGVTCVFIVHFGSSDTFYGL